MELPELPDLETKTPTGRRKVVHYRYVPCKSCGEVSAVPLKRDGSPGAQGVAWTYGPCPFCKKARR